MTSVDHVLRLYAETIQSPHLHYGLWDDPSQVDPEALSLTDIRNAQERYIAHLSTYIPEGVKTILDVGCGIGGNAAFLRQHGFRVDALSPDPYQREVFRKQFDSSLEFHFSKFETFETEKKYDLILMSESAAYIKMGPGVEKAWALLSDGGYWLVSDYFIVYADGHGSPHTESAHHLDRYLAVADEAGFDLLKNDDITDKVMPTLDVAHYFYHRFVLPIARYADYSLGKRAPRVTRFLKWVYGRKVEKKLRQVDYLNSDEFRKYRKYVILLFQKERK